jgi:hypothetical protein
MFVVNFIESLTSNRTPGLDAMMPKPLPTAVKKTPPDEGNAVLLGTVARKGAK